MKIRNSFLTRNSFITMLAGAVLWAGPAQAQGTGAVAATVVDDASGQALESALVHIEALDLGGFSGEQGRFNLDEVPAGEHELKAELIGYSQATVTVMVQAGETTEVELRLEPSAFLFEAMAVTGTAFKESPINLPYAVTTANRAKLKEQGSPQPVDFFKNLSASHGVIGERSSWYNANQAATLSESIANVNLRGLGASRTLVLFNGRRQTYVPARLIGGRFVDVNAIPSIALDRVEVLKEGAAAIYGSDAVAGVANFLTRSDFTGFEVSGSHEYLAGAGDSDAGAIWGGQLGGAHAVVAGEWRKRAELPSTERDYLLQPCTARRRAAPRMVEPRQPGHLRRRRAGPLDGRHPRPAVRAVRRLPGVLDLPLPLSAVREPDRGDEPYPRLRRDQRCAGQWHGVSLRGPVGPGGHSELVHHPFVPALPTDGHEHHGGRARPPGPGGLLRGLW